MLHPWEDERLEPPGELWNPAILIFSPGVVEFGYFFLYIHLKKCVYIYIYGWWLNSTQSEKCDCQKWYFFSPRKGEEKKHLKPPNRYCIRLYKGKTRQHG